MDNDDKVPWQYRPGGGSEASDVPDEEELVAHAGKSDDKPVSWTASEYIDHENGLSWYGMLFLATVVVSGSIYLLTKDYLATGTIIILGVIVATAAARRPEKITYQLSSTGIKIGEKFYSFRGYRSFYIVKDGALHSISLMPLKRFSPALSIYFDPADEEHIVKRLSERLPFEEHQMDLVDKISRRLRF
jgi:hypothetical protein